MKYRYLHKVRTYWVISMLAAGAFADLAPAATPMAPVPPELEVLVPSLAARRLSVSDFSVSRQKWGELHGYRMLPVRVRQIHRDGSWVRVDFDGVREGREAGPEVFQLAWNEGEEGPAPFALNQAVSIWVSPAGSVDGFELGRSVYRWRHLSDGAVELQVLDEMVDGGTVIVRMIPDRYSGSEVGKTVYWKGEGLCTGAAGAVPLGLKIYPDDLAAAQEKLAGEAKKAVWVSPGMTPAEDEIRVLLRNFAGTGVVAEAAVRGSAAAVPFKIRLRAEPMATSAHSKRVAERQGNKGGSRTSPPAAAKKGALSGLFSAGAKDKESGEKPDAQATPESVGGNEAATEAPSRPGSTSAGVPALPVREAAAPPAAQPAAAAPALPAPVAETARFDERWYDLLKDRALKYRRQALEGLSSKRSPGSAISQEWVEVAYESQPGEPLRAVVATLPQVPKKQFVPESRGMP